MSSFKRPVNVSSYEIGESSHSRRSRRMSQLIQSASETCLPSYSDCGDCSCVCEFCGALFWFAEKVGPVFRDRRPKYNQCCKSGSVVLPFPLNPPSTIKALFDCSHFMDNIRAYNTMFSMTSFGAEVDHNINMGHGPYVFKVSGQISHWIGSLCPPPNEKPRFLQMYIYDTANEVTNRLRFFRSSTADSLSPTIVSTISQTLHDCNEYVRLFKNASDLCADASIPHYSICLYSNVGDKRYDIPPSGTLGAIVVDDNSNVNGYDIVLHCKDGPPKRVSKLHPGYMPLQYPLLFPFGEQGWSPSLRLRDTTPSRDKKMTINMYYSYQLHDRQSVYCLLLKGGRLFQQYLVDAYTCIEQNRLDYISANQDLFRSEYVAGIYDAISRGDTQTHNIGQRIFLPSSFTGGPRYMYKHYHDALAICRVHGNPQYFVTFTCNVKWPEIVRHLHTVGCTQAENRPDIISRVFQMKVEQFITFVKNDKTFGDVVAYLYTIEFQKRGLPHCHTLLWVSTSFRIHSAADIDTYITAQFPNPDTEPSLYKTITECMIHGPCGLLNPNSPCMREGKCSKNYPKSLEIETRFDKEGYVHYKRPTGMRHVLQNGIQVDNGYVVPYNKRLCSHFNAHINVEYCGWNMMIKYLFKYISKGADRVKFGIRSHDHSAVSAASTSSSPVNEISNFQDGRFICPHEASWRILNFAIHQRYPAVQILAVHLENMQHVTFRDNARLQSIISNPSFGKTTLTEWLYSNATHPDETPLTYVDYPSKYRWDPCGKIWILRRQLRPSIGRLAYVHPTSGELFYLRMLLSHQKSCKSYIDIRTVSGVTYLTFREACQALGLTGDDREWYTAFSEASSWATSSELRSLFVHMLLFCEISAPLLLWQSEWKRMADDILFGMNRSSANNTFFVNDFDLKQQLLLQLDELLHAANPTKSLKDFGLPLPSPNVLATLGNRLLMEETSYDRCNLSVQHTEMHHALNVEQLHIYDTIVDADRNQSQLLLFVYGHGGTGKTFLWTTIISFFRSIGKIVLAVAASGIASLLLPSGRTAHSRFNIPFDLTDKTTCYIKKNTQLSELLKQTSLIIWDEAPMSDRRCFECLDKSLRDVLDNNSVPFGGKSILLGGDFRQTLPVKSKGTPSEIISFTLPTSYLWPFFTIYKLHSNMRLKDAPSDPTSTMQPAEFASWLLDVGNGMVGDVDLDDPHNTRILQIPPDFLLHKDDRNIHALIRFVYSDSILTNPCPEDLSNRAIICPKNETANEINKMILDLLPGEGKSYLSYDSMIPHAQNAADCEVLYPQEYLNKLSFSGIPPHKLTLKINTPVMLLRNLNQTLGLCNGTRLLVSQLLPNIVEANVITGTSIGNRVNNSSNPSRTSLSKRMNIMSKQSISSLTAKSDTTQLRFRVIRKWKLFGNQLTFLFVDADDDAIEATCDTKSTLKFERLLHVNNCYLLDNYVAVPAKESYRTVDNDTMIMFGNHATVTPIEDSDIPTHFFNFTSYADLHKNLYDKNKILTDFIGRVVDIQDVPNKSKNKLIRLKIQAESGELIEVALWRQIADAFDMHAVTHTSDIIIMAITALRVSLHIDTLQLGSTDATVTYINPPIEACFLLAEKFTTMSVEPPPLALIYNEAAEKNILPLIDAINRLDQTNPKSSSTCLASISEIDTEQNRTWFYTSCSKCKSKAYEKGSTIFCLEHGTVPNPSYKYRFTATITDVNDLTMTTKAVFFDETVSSMTNVNCYTTVIDNKHNNPHVLPPLLQDIINKPFIFQIQPRTESHDDSLTVTKVFLPPPPSILTTPVPLTPITKPPPRQRDKGISIEPEIKKRR